MKLSAVKGALSILLAASVLGGCSQNPDGLTPVTLNEVAHSIFYAPQYAAMSWDILRRRALTWLLSTAKVPTR